MKITIIENANHEDLLAILQGMNNKTTIVEEVQNTPVPVQEKPKAEEKPVKEDSGKEEPKSEEKPHRGRRKKTAKEEPKAEENNTAEYEEATAPTPAPVEEPKDEEPKTEKKEESEATPQVNRTDVINLGKKLVKAGHSKEVTKLMKETYGASKFSDISDDQLPDVYKKFKEIEDAA